MTYYIIAQPKRDQNFNGYFNTEVAQKTIDHPIFDKDKFSKYDRLACVLLSARK